MRHRTSLLGRFRRVKIGGAMSAGLVLVVGLLASTGGPAGATVNSISGSATALTIGGVAASTGVSGAATGTGGFGPTGSGTLPGFSDIVDGGTVALNVPPTACPGAGGGILPGVPTLPLGLGIAVGLLDQCTQGAAARPPRPVSPRARPTWPS